MVDYTSLSALEQEINEKAKKPMYDKFKEVDL